MPKCKSDVLDNFKNLICDGASCKVTVVDRHWFSRFYKIREYDGIFNYLTSIAICPSIKSKYLEVSEYIVV